MPAVRPLAPRAGPAIVALYVLAGSALLGIGTDVRRIVVIGQYLDGIAEFDRALQADDLVTFATLVGLVAAAVAAVLCARWLLGLRAGHAVLGPALGGLGPVWAWLGLVAAALLAGLVTRLGLSAETLEEVRDADLLDVAGQVLVLLAALAGVVVVNRLTLRHDGAAAQAGVLADPPARRRRGDDDAGDGGAGGGDEDPGGLRVLTEDELRARENPRGHGAP